VRLNSKFGNLRYILTKFGRVVNLYDAFDAFYKRRQIRMNFDSSFKQALSGKELDVKKFPPTQGGLKFSESDFNNHLIRSPFKSSPARSKHKKPYESKDIYTNLAKDEKYFIIKNFMKDVAKKWREDYE
jgi:hypothetical protein